MQSQQEPAKPGLVFIAVIALIAIAIPVLIIATLAFGITNGSQAVTSTGLIVNIPSGVGANVSQSFEPATITVVVGVNSTILWTQNDISPHTVTSVGVPGGADSFDSGFYLNKGQPFSVTLSVPGTYLYHCSYHSWMKGTIIVKSG